MLTKKDVFGLAISKDHFFSDFFLRLKGKIRSNSNFWLNSNGSGLCGVKGCGKMERGNTRSRPCFSSRLRWCANAPGLAHPARPAPTDSLPLLLREVRRVRDAPTVRRPLLQDRLRQDDRRPDPVRSPERPEARRRRQRRGPPLSLVG